MSEFANTFADQSKISDALKENLSSREENQELENKYNESVERQNEKNENINRILNLVSEPFILEGAKSVLDRARGGIKNYLNRKISNVIDEGQNKIINLKKSKMSKLNDTLENVKNKGGDISDDVVNKTNQNLDDLNPKPRGILKTPGESQNQTRNVRFQLPDEEEEQEMPETQTSSSGRIAETSFASDEGQDSLFPMRQEMMNRTEQQPRTTTLSRDGEGLSETPTQQSILDEDPEAQENRPLLNTTEEDGDEDDPLDIPEDNISDNLFEAPKEGESEGGQSLGQEVEEGASKGLEKGAEIEEDGGGEEDPIADVVGAGFLLGNILAPLFEKHKKPPPLPPLPINPNVPLGV